MGDTTLVEIGTSNGGELQNAFKHFRQRKMKGQGLNRSQHARPSEKFLRKRFLDLAFSYLNVPYAKKHYDATNCSCEGCIERGEQLYHAPLFLDCCGLVRRCLQDMKEEIGFTIGPFHQSYQFDTLRDVRVGTLSELQPGDLIFYEGEFTNPNAKPKQHNIVHVEIYLGGERTLGSRERYKWVKEYDDYRIENSPRWRLIRYHFCKIDPWLRGECTSHCPEHKWEHRWELRRAIRGGGKRSIFDESGDE